MENHESSRSFEQILEEVERIVGRLQDGSVPLESALDLYERGFGLVQQAQARLLQARTRLEDLKKGTIVEETEA